MFLEQEARRAWIILRKTLTYSAQAGARASENEKEALARSDPLSNASPVGPVSGFPGRGRQEPQRPWDGRVEDRHPRSKSRDGVVLHAPEAIARRLLRERVLFRTRANLGLREGEFVPSFAEDVDAEPLAAFVGRLLGAQNQLAALRVRELDKPELRHRLDEAMREGTAEVIEMLSRDPQDEHAIAAVEVVAEALAEYGRRLAELA